MSSIRSQLHRRMILDRRVSVRAGLSAANIRAAERRLGVRISGGYRDFLRRFGSAMIGHNEVLGASKAKPNIISETLAWRKYPAGLWPPRAIVISVGAGGNEYYLLTGRTRRSPAPVFLWDHELNEHRRLATSFDRWLLSVLRRKDLFLG